MNEGEYYKTLSIDFNKLLTTCEDYNVIIGVGNDVDYMKFHAHSCILRARSPYFYSALSKEWVKRNEEGLIIFEKPNIHPKIFQCILKYIYGGMIDLNDYEPMFILDLIIASDELLLTELCKFSQDFLMRVQDKWIRENPIKILTHSTAFHLESCKELIDYCLEIICDNPSLIFEIQNYAKIINEQILIEILKRDDLQLDEMSLWKHIINWGIEQINKSRISNYEKRLMIQDGSKWVEKDLIELEIILKNCVPLIRIDLISCKELPIELQPFQRMLTKNDSFIDDNSSDLYSDENLMCKSLLLSHRMPSIYPIDSTIIKWRHAAIISKWIDRQDALYRKASHTFRLLLRGTRDGFTSQTFHELCDNIGATIVVMKVVNTKQIIGGYNPVGWKGGFFGTWIKTADSFIFSFGDGKNLNQAVLSRIRKDHDGMALFCADVRGPSFGCHDLWMPNFNNLSLRCTSKSSYYEKTIIDTRKFDVEEYEVFQVIDKKRLINAEKFT